MRLAFVDLMLVFGIILKNLRITSVCIFYWPKTYSISNWESMVVHLMELHILHVHSNIHFSILLMPSCFFFYAWAHQYQIYFVKVFQQNNNQCFLKGIPYFFSLLFNFILCLLSTPQSVKSDINNNYINNWRLLN